jgi:hypothetical protein
VRGAVAVKLSKPQDDARDDSERSEDLPCVPAQPIQGWCPDSAQVLRVQHYAPYLLELAMAVAVTAWTRKSGNAVCCSKLITMQILLMQACSKVVLSI